MAQEKPGPHRFIIDRFGGIVPAAKALGHKYPTTVQGWYERGWIPARQQKRVLDAAEQIGVVLTPADFFRAPESIHA